MAHKVVFAPEAQADLLELYDTIARDGGEERALAYVERIEASCLDLATSPERGTRPPAFFHEHLYPPGDPVWPDDALGSVEIRSS